MDRADDRDATPPGDTDDGSIANLGLTCRTVAEAIGREHPVAVHLWLYDIDREHLYADARWDPSLPGEPPTGAVVMLDPAVTRELFDGRRSMRVRRHDVPPGWRLDAVADALLVPMVVVGRPIGVLVATRAVGARVLDDGEVQTAIDAAAEVAFAVDHARLLHGSQRSAWRQTSLACIGERALAPEGLDDLERLVVDEVRRAMDADCACIFEACADGATAVMVAEIGMSAFTRAGATFALSPPARERLAARDTAVSTIDVDTTHHERSLAGRNGFAASCSVLLVPSDGRPLFIGVGRVTHRRFAGPDRRFLAATAHLVRAALELRKTQRRLHLQANTDALTGLANRPMLLERLGDAIGLARVDATPVALVLTDLDGFKLVNDSMGHGEGDRLLVAVAARLAGIVRPGDLVARLGGDEFALLCPGVDERGAVMIAERALAALAAPVRLSHRSVVPRASTGVAVLDDVPLAAAETPETAATLVKHADLAMYRAKRAGGHRVAVYDVALDEQVRRRLAIEEGLRDALATGSLSLAFQPLVDLASGRIGGVETLVRWDDVELGTVSPAEFIPIAEQSDLVCEIDAWVLRAAARQAVAWAAAGVAPDRVGVNLSARNFVEPGMAARVAATLAAVDCPPERMIVEITETLLIDGLGPDSVRALLDVGVAVAIDDYGAGFSSLAQLKRVPVRFLKMDRSFVAGLVTDATDAAIVRSTTALARELGKTVIAEGVETVEQLREVQRLGCTVAQGFLLGRPSDAATMTRWLTDGLDAPLAELLAR